MRWMLLTVFVLTVSSFAGQVNVMSYNIRYANAADGDNAWSNRKSELLEMLNRYHPDILGVQEALHEQVLYLSENLKGYRHVGVGRDDGKQAGEYCAIYYDTTKYTALRSKTYWLSETPDSISVGWDASMVRIVTTATFLSRVKADTIHVFNAHFDHMGKLARLNSAKLILELTARLYRPTDKLIFMGDLNMQPDEDGVMLLAEEFVDTRATLGSLAEGPDGTFNDFQKGYHMERRIDYIFVRNALPSSFRTITERRSNGSQLSDHYAIWCGLTWN